MSLLILIVFKQNKRGFLPRFLSLFSDKVRIIVGTFIKVFQLIISAKTSLVVSFDITLHKQNNRFLVLWMKPPPPHTAHPIYRNYFSCTDKEKPPFSGQICVWDNCVRYWECPPYKGFLIRVWLHLSSFLHWALSAYPLYKGVRCRDGRYVFFVDISSTRDGWSL